MSARPVTFVTDRWLPAVPAVDEVFAVRPRRGRGSPAERGRDLRVSGASASRTGAAASADGVTISGNRIPPHRRRALRGGRVVVGRASPGVRGWRIILS